MQDFSSTYGVTSVDWGDFDNDGDLDLVMNGSNSGNVWRNNGPTAAAGERFTVVDGYLGNLFYDGSVAWGDFDNDGYLDIWTSGTDSDLSNGAQIYRNNRDGTFSRAN